MRGGGAALKCTRVNIAYMRPAGRWAVGSIDQSHRSQERSAMFRLFLALFAFFVLTFGVAAGSHAAEPLPARPGPDPQHDARAGVVLEPLQVHPGGAHLPALGLNDRLGRARHQGAQQPQVRHLEQRRLLFRRAGAGPGPGDPDLFPGAGALAAGVFRPAADLTSTPATRRCPTTRRC